MAKPAYIVALVVGLALLPLAMGLGLYGRRDEAAAEFRRAVELRPDYREAVAHPARADTGSG